MQSVDEVLRQAAADLEAIGARWAVIGGLAVAFRAEPRFTKDVDLAVAVADDQEAEGIVNRLQVRGYALASLIGQDYVNRLATARMVRPLAGSSSAFIDLRGPPFRARATGPSGSAPFGAVARAA